LENSSIGNYARSRSHICSNRPYDNSTNNAQTLKSVSAVYIFEKFPKLKGRKFWGSGLWSRGTYYATVGSISEESVKKYIDNQKRK